MSDFSNQIKNFVKDKKNDKKEVKDIIEYIEGSWGLNFKLFPIQRFILKCFYGIQLNAVERNIQVCDDEKSKILYSFTELEYLHYLIKERRTNLRSVEDVKKHKNKLILICGRRSGKSLMTSAISSYETYRLLTLENPQEYYKLKKNSKISITCVATGKDQAGEVFTEIKSHYNDCPFFKSYLHNNAATHSSFHTEYDKRYSLIPSIHVRAKSCQGKGLRGAANVVAIMDEIAHFIQEAQSDASDEAVYKAIVPSTSNFTNPDGQNDGKVIMISSPLGKTGVFWNEYLYAIENTLEDTHTLVIQAPTWEINPNIAASDLRSWKAKDPVTFQCEYGAIFTDEITNWLEDRQYLMQCIDRNILPKDQGVANLPHYIGIDLGFTEDGTAIAIGHINQKGKLELDFHKVISPKNPADAEFLNTSFSGAARILDTEKLVDYIVALSKRFYIKAGIFDQEEGFSFEQSLARRGITTIRRFPMSDRKKSDMYQKFKKLLMDSKIYMYYDEQMVRELTHLQRKAVGDYLIRVMKPSSGGYKDDLSDALARMIYLAYEDMEKGSQDSKYILNNVGKQNLFGANPKTYLRNRSRFHNYYDPRRRPKK